MSHFDFQKMFIFKSLPAFFANQRLCPGQPSAPLNFSLYGDYVDELQQFFDKHPQCFNCNPETPPRFNITDNLLMVSELETSLVQKLPHFIAHQFLFEDEPVAVPCDVEEFYNYYVQDGDYKDCSDQSQVQSYHQHLIQVVYRAAVEKWKAGMSDAKLLRYKTYLSKRDIYLEKFCQKTTIETVAKAIAEMP